MEPLRLAFEVACPVERAFDLWANHTSRWWPHRHSVSAEPGLEIIFEPRPGGRIYERTPGGAEHEWGEVLAWEPPRRLVYLWHLRFDRRDATEVEVTFSPAGDGTSVAITHRGWERLGAAGPERRERNRRGWAGVTPRFRVAALVDADELVIAELTSQGGEGFIAPLHIHHADDEAWLVLEGALLVRRGDRDVPAGPGEAVLVPRGTPHTFWNAHDGPTRYLLAMTPRIQRLIDALHAPSDRPVEELFRAHASEYLGWPSDQ
jgi:mannose-6-phosphate isomerase-like protein (cupin superfamily)